MDIDTRISFVKRISIFSEVDANTLKEVAEKMRDIIEKSTFNYLEHKLKVTVSIGLSSSDHRDIEKSLLITEADRALYHAKENGRNQVQIFDEI